MNTNVMESNFAGASSHMGGEGREREGRRVLSRARSSSPSPSSISSHLVLTTTTAKLTSYQLYDNHISNMTAARATECSLAAVREWEGGRLRLPLAERERNPYSISCTPFRMPAAVAAAAVGRQVNLFALSPIHREREREGESKAVSLVRWAGTN